MPLSCSLGGSPRRANARLGPARDKSQSRCGYVTRYTPSSGPYLCINLVKSMLGFLVVAIPSILHAMADDCVTTGLMLWNIVWDAMVHARAHAVQTVALAVIAFVYVTREPLAISGEYTC